MESNDSIVVNLASQMAVMRDVRAAEPIWAMIATNKSEAPLSAVYTALHTLYFGEQYYGSGNPNEQDFKPFHDAAMAQIQHGSDAQRTVALALMMQPFAQEAAEEAKKIYADAKTSDALRVDAFQILLLSQDSAGGHQTATAALSSDTKPAFKQMALRFLALGSQSLRQLHGFWLNTISWDTDGGYMGDGRPVVIKPPAGVTVEMVKPFLASADHEQAACAGYLLCLLGKKEGLPPLLAYWKEQNEGRYNSLTPQVYRAIAMLDDDSQTPVLEQIYKTYEKRAYEVRPFYWTIRNMHGPNILKLRKTIRDEVGMDSIK
jgi:hypothetical protein